ncbi:MAG: hypothetical protein FVQ77_06535 [Cytophagales bacterium]|nr:hypothetical protein [Cytophagales bacterium]
MARSDIHKTFPFPLKIMSLMVLIAVGFIDHKIRSRNEPVKEISNEVFSSYKTPDPLKQIIIANSASKKIENSISPE